MTFVRCTKAYSKIQIFLDFHLKKGEYSHKTNAEFILKLHVNALEPLVLLLSTVVSMSL